MKADFDTDYQTENLVKLKIWGFDYWVTPRFVKLYADRQYEPVSSRVVLAIQRQLTDKNLILDLGAHYGYYSLLLASRGKQPIVAVEPVAPNTLVLKKNVNANKFNRIQVISAAVSNEVGEREMRISVASDSSSFNPHPTGPTLKTEKVKTVTIDKLAGKQPVGLIKIDVEGHELPALQGGMGVIRQDKPAIVFEYHPDSQRLGGLGEGELLKWLLKFGYRLWAVDEDQAMLVPLKASVAHQQALDTFGHEGYGNILAMATPLPRLSLAQSTPIQKISSFPIPGTPVAGGVKMKLNDTGIGLVADNIPKTTDWDRWWLERERNFYKQEYVRVDEEVRLFKKKWIYRLGHGFKNR